MVPSLHSSTSGVGPHGSSHDDVQGSMPQLRSQGPHQERELDRHQGRVPQVQVSVQGGGTEGSSPGRGRQGREGGRRRKQEGRSQGEEEIDRGRVGGRRGRAARGRRVRHLRRREEALQTQRRRIHDREQLDSHPHAGCRRPRQEGQERRAARQESFVGALQRQGRHQSPARAVRRRLSLRFRPTSPHAARHHALRQNHDRLVQQVHGLRGF